MVFFVTLIMKHQKVSKSSQWQLIMVSITLSIEAVVLIQFVRSGDGGCRSSRSNSNNSCSCE